LQNENIELLRRNNISQNHVNDLKKKLLEKNNFKKMAVEIIPLMKTHINQLETDNQKLQHELELSRNEILSLKQKNGELN
jgi:primosomal protein N''